VAHARRGTLNLAYAGETAADVEKSGDTWV
jgi:hypothetical protein